MIIYIAKNINGLFNPSGEEYNISYKTLLKSGMAQLTKEECTKVCNELNQVLKNNL